MGVIRRGARRGRLRLERLQAEFDQWAHNRWGAPRVGRCEPQILVFWSILHAVDGVERRHNLGADVCYDEEVPRDVRRVPERTVGSRRVLHVGVLR